MIKRLYVLILLILLIILIILASGCLLSKPIITIDASLRSLSEEEYMDINVGDLKGPKLEDFRYYELKVEGKNLNNIEFRHVTVPGLEYIRKALIKYNPNIWVVGNDLCQNNSDEDFFIYDYKVLLNMREISKDDLKDILEEFEVIVYIKTKGGYEVKEEYNLGLDLR